MTSTAWNAEYPATFIVAPYFSIQHSPFSIASIYFAAFRRSAHLFFIISEMRLRPSGEMPPRFRLRGFASFVPVVLRRSAQRFVIISEMRRRASGDILRRLRPRAPVAPVLPTASLPLVPVALGA